MAAPRPTVNRSGPDLLICLALLALTMAVYWPVWRFEFVNYDDGEYVYENLRVQAGLTADNVAWAFRTFHFENWHPLTWLSYLLDYQLFGLNSGAFHLVNLLFHALNTLLLFAVFKKMTSARWPSALVAALFAVHPLHVESVAWIAERKDVLSAFFWMLTMWAYVRYVERPKLGRYSLALLFFALGLMAKPMLVTLPFVLLLLDFWPLRRIQARGPERQIVKASKGSAPLPNSHTPTLQRSNTATLQTLLLEKVPFFLLTIGSCLVTFFAQHGARVTTTSLPVTQRIANAAVSYARYLVKTLWPKDLAVYYPHPGTWPAWQVAGATALLAALTFLALWRWRSRPFLAVGWLWYVGTLVPVIGLVQVGGQSMADRYMYLPLIGLLIMVAWGAAELAERWRIKGAGLALAAGAVVCGCLAMSSLQARFWSNSVGLFEHALAVAGGSTVAHNTLGDALLLLGKTNEATAHFTEALAIDPKDFMAYGNFGNIFFNQGKTDQAIARYQEGLQLNPKSPELNHNMGMALARQGKFLEAIPYYFQALQNRAEYADAFLSLGNSLVALNRFDEAITNYATVLRLRPNFAPAHFNLANALLQKGKPEEALPHYAAAIRAQPNHAEAHENLGLALSRMGKNQDALVQFTEAVRLKPENAEFHFQLASLLLTQKKAGDAVTHYREAIRLRPNFVPALNDLAWVLATQQDDKIRNGSEAVTLAQQACELTGSKQAFMLGTLGAAYAEVGRFPEAVTAAQKAIELATAAGQKDLAATNQKLLESYRAGKPYRDVP